MDTVFIALRVLVVLGVIVALLWYVQRRLTKGKSGRARRGNAVTVVGRQGVGSKASVVVVDVDGTRFVLGVTERAVNVLHSGDRPIDLEAEVTQLNPVRKTFAKPIEPSEKDARTQDASKGEQPRQDAEYLNAQQRASVFDEALKGSILSPATWRQASSAVRPKR
ncbi:flagellar biosynthetic protein FliO [Leifsonia sp. NPDC058230]|uniref:flagellar biosynthetic protein FliO n=1 Tax=Leifsonia sp. NPDC058230 TaxID=3346391 RepID=UPI0036DC52BC